MKRGELHCDFNPRRRTALRGRGAIEKKDSRVEVKHPGRFMPEDYGPLFTFSSKMKKILHKIDRSAITDVTVLVTGESGTGKELVARTLHARSLRQSKPLIKIFCGALPGSLLESELFGYEKGAFTGAIRKKLGKFDYANGGILFLDEIGEIPFSLQAKLLQVLQGGVFSRLGGGYEVKVDVKVVATTNKVLRNAIEAGAFREDLFYRINEVEIRLPPLRERIEEIPFWVDYFLQKFNTRFNKKYPGLSSVLLNKLFRYHWPGNIRELENFIQEIVLLEDELLVWNKLNGLQKEKENKWVGPNSGKSIFVRQSLPSPRHEKKVGGKYPTLREFSRMAAQKAERELIWIVLNETDGNRKKAARILEVNYTTLCRKIGVYSLGTDENMAP